MFQIILVQGVDVQGVEAGLLANQQSGQVATQQFVISTAGGYYHS